jgi:hypothetical protein
LEALLWYSVELIYSRIVFENEVKSNQTPPYFIIMLFHPDSGDVYSWLVSSGLQRQSSLSVYVISTINPEI